MGHKLCIYLELNKICLLFFIIFLFKEFFFMKNEKKVDICCQTYKRMYYLCSRKKEQRCRKDVSETFSN
jgi:hypothetical protein